MPKQRIRIFCRATYSFKASLQTIYLHNTGLSLLLICLHQYRYHCGNLCFGQHPKTKCIVHTVHVRIHILRLPMHTQKQHKSYHKLQFPNSSLYLPLLPYASSTTQGWRQQANDLVLRQQKALLFLLSLCFQHPFYQATEYVIQEEHKIRFIHTFSG